MVDTTRRIVIEVDNTGARADIAQTDRAMTGLGRTADGVNSTFNRLSAAASAVAAALATSQIIAYADAWTVVNNRLANSIRESETLADVTERVFNIANDTRSSLDATAALYQSLERSTRELGVSTDDLATITTNLNRAFIVSGASAVDAENATRQLGQALAAGALRGDEYNSIAENGSRITIALADALGVNVGELRELAAQGALTSEVFVDVFTNVQTTTSLLDEYNNVSVTFAQNTQVATNNLTQFVGESATVQEVVAGVGQTLVIASENLETLLDIVTVLASVFVARLTPAIIANISALSAQVASSTRATVTTNALGQVISRTTIAANVGAVAMRGLAASMALVGGPLGIAIIATTALFAFSDSADDASASTDALGVSVDELATQFRALSAIELTQTQAENNREIAELEELLSGLRSELEATSQEQQDLGQPINTSALSESIIVVENDLLRARREAEALNIALGSVPESTLTGGVSIDTTTAGDAQIDREAQVTANLRDQLAFRQRFFEQYTLSINALQDDSFAQQRLQQQANEAEQLRAVQERLQQEELAIAEARTKDLENQQLTNEQRLLLELEYDEQLRVQKEIAQQGITEVEQAGADARNAIREAERAAAISTTITLGQNLMSAFDGQSRSLFEAGKAAAVAGTIISTYESATKSYDALAGIPVVGPALGAAAAAAAIAGGIANVKRIQSTQYGATSSQSGSTYGSFGGASSGAGSATATSPSAVESTQSQRFVEIRGLPDDAVLSGAQVKDLVTELASSDDDIIVAISSGQSAGSREGLI